jgi:hypothetical protein
VPVLAAVVLLATALAPIARARMEPTLATGLVLLAVSLMFVRDGALVVATGPGVVAAVLLGCVAARAVRRAVWVLPMLLAAAVSDAHSVEQGVTRRLLDDGASSGSGTHAAATAVLQVPAEFVSSVDLFVLHVPAATGTWMLGIVDVVALGLLLGLTHLNWLPLGRTALALGAAVAFTLGASSAVPVLPVLGLAWLLVHARLVWRATRFSLRRLTYLGG